MTQMMDLINYSVEIEKLAEEQGWNTTTINILMVKFISKDDERLEDFYHFCADIARREKEMFEACKEDK